MVNYIEELPKILNDVPYVYDLRISYMLHGECWEINVYFVKMRQNHEKPLTKWLYFSGKTLQEAAKKVCKWVEGEKCKKTLMKK